MIIDIQPEYDGFICGIWQRLSDKTNDFVISQQELEEVYNSVSLVSMRFMRVTLERLERENG